MDLSFLRDALRRMRWQTEQLGTTGKIGIGLLVFSAVFFVAAVLPRQAESAALMASAEAMQTRLRAEPAQAAQAHGKPVRKVRGFRALQVFYDFFPEIDSTPLRIREVVQSAMQSGVEISGTDYRMVREKDVKLVRYEMALPVRGQYSQVRGFIAEVLRAVPAMALVDISIRRESADAGLLEASLKFNLYLREGGK